MKCYNYSKILFQFVKILFEFFILIFTLTPEKVIAIVSMGVDCLFFVKDLYIGKSGPCYLFSSSFNNFFQVPH